MKVVNSELKWPQNVKRVISFKQSEGLLVIFSGILVNDMIRNELPLQSYINRVPRNVLKSWLNLTAGVALSSVKQSYCEVLSRINLFDMTGMFGLQGVDEGPDGLKLISDIIREQLSIEMSVLMGANIANEVAEEKFCETTIGNGLEFMIHLETGDKLKISSPDMGFKCYATLIGCSSTLHCRFYYWDTVVTKSSSTQTYYWLLLGKEVGHIPSHTLKMYF